MGKLLSLFTLAGMAQFALATQPAVKSSATTQPQCYRLLMWGMEHGEDGALVMVDPLTSLLTNYTSFTRLQLFRAIYGAMPDIGWLTRKVNMAPQDRNAKAHPESPSMVLGTFGADLGPSSVHDQPANFHPELDRSLTSLYILQLWLRGDYEGFVHAQRTEAPKAMPLLSLDRFHHWRAFFIELLAKSPEKAQLALNYPQVATGEWIDFEKFRTLIVLMVIHDLGKSKDWSEAAIGVSAAISHDNVIIRGLTNRPFMAPSFASLNPEYRELVIKLLRAEFNMGQFVQAEAPAAMLARVQGMDKPTLKMYLAHLILDVAGAHATVDPMGARLFHAGLEKSYSLGYNYMLRVADGQSAVDVRRAFVSDRVHPLGVPTDSDEDYVIGQLVLYSRALTVEKAQAAIEAYRQLPEVVQAILRKEFLQNGVDNGWGTLLEYGPQLIENLEQQAIAAGVENPAVTARKRGFTLIARILQQLRMEILKNRPGSGMLHVNINAIAAAVKMQPPLDLDRAIFSFLADGNQVSVTVLPNTKPFVRGVEPIASLGTFLDRFSAKYIVIVGMGGGSDAIQGGAIANLVERQAPSKQVLGVVSIRGAKTGSIAGNVSEGVTRSIVNGGRSPFPGVQEILKETTVPGRNFERTLVRDGRPTVALLCDSEAHYATLVLQLVQAVHLLTEGKGIGYQEEVLIIGLDTGGDVLIDPESSGATSAGVTSQQDTDVLRAINALSNDRADYRYSGLVGVVAAGVESPISFLESGAPSGASVYIPSAEDARAILSDYRRWELTPDAPNPEGLYSRTSYAWQLALAGRVGAHPVPLPEKNVTSSTNPWDPFAYLHEDAAGIVFYSPAKLLEQLPAAATSRARR